MSEKESKDSPEWVSSTEFTVKIDGGNLAFEFDVGPQGRLAHMDAPYSDDHPELVKKVLSVFGTAWPPPPFRVRIDESKQVTDIEIIPKKKGK